MDDLHYCIWELCHGCTMYRGGDTQRCPIQDQPGWLWIEKGECWSKRTDRDLDRQIRKNIKTYKNAMGELA